MSDILRQPPFGSMNSSDVGEVTLKLLREKDEGLVRGLVEYDPQHFTQVGEIMPEICSSPELLREWVRGERPFEAKFARVVKFGSWVTGTMVGCAGFREHDPSVAEIWYWIGGEHIRRGYGAASILMLRDILFLQGYPEVTAFTYQSNKASLGALGKTDFRCVDRLRADGRNYLRYSAYAREFNVGSLRNR